ncbi:T-complex protein 1 subunit delta [Elysia marginata]|uniref:T-complex protein 1 subunit delta n=1 Tax=Elysia marginata TaxID=1093978 RepID=A0AAV4GF19_9GAST|nr:T-complex protein 1 subunit delta [Elysia marginata]
MPETLYFGGKITILGACPQTPLDRLPPSVVAVKFRQFHDASNAGLRNEAVADAIRTALGPRGMDKMIQAENGDVTITNDGATILKQMQVLHPAAKMLVELSKAQDIEAGDGTTSVVVLAGSLLDASANLLARGIHPTAISEAFQGAAQKSTEILESLVTPLDLNDRESLLKSASTSLNSKTQIPVTNGISRRHIGVGWDCKRPLV